nr:hypothetical protein [Sinorhizobium medicae]
MKPQRLDDDEDGEKEEADLQSPDDGHGEISVQGSSEPFRSDQRHDEVGSERGGDEQADKGIDHRFVLKPAEDARVTRKHHKATDGGSKEKGIGHGHSPDVSVIRRMRAQGINFRLG